MNWLFSKLVEVINELVFSVLAWCVSIFTDSLSITSARFYQMFVDGNNNNFLASFQNNVIFPLAAAIIMGNMVVQLYRSMFSKQVDQDVDEPIPLVFRSIAYLFLSLNWNLLVFGTEGLAPENGWNSPCLMNIYSNIWGLIDGKYFKVSELLTSKNIFTSTMGNSLETSITDVLSGQTIGLGAAVISLVASIIIGFVLGWTFIKMMFTYTSRYVELKIFEIFMPLALAAGGSNSTKQITKKYIWLYMSDVINLLLSVFFCYMYAFMMAKTITWNGAGMAENIFCLSFTLGISRFYNKLESYLQQIGLSGVANAPNPRSPLATLSEIARTAMQAYSYGKTMGLVGPDKNISNSAPNLTSSNAMPFADGMAADSMTSETTGSNDETTMAAMDAIRGAETTSGEQLKDVENAIVSATNGEFFAWNGEKPNASNSGFAMYKTNEDGTADVLNMAVDPNGQIRDTMDDSVISGASIDQMESSLYGTGIPDNDNLSILSKDTNGNISATNLERNPETGGWVNSTTGEELSATDRMALNNRMKNGDTMVASMAQSDISDFKSKDFSDSVAGAKSDVNGVKHGSLRTENGLVPTQFQERTDGKGFTTTVGGKAMGSVSEAVGAIGAVSGTFTTDNGKVDATFDKNGQTKIGDKTYSTPDAAAKAVGASGMKLHTGNMSQHGQLAKSGKFNLGGKKYDSLDSAVKTSGAKNMTLDTLNGVVSGAVSASGGVAIAGKNYSNIGAAAKALGASSAILHTPTGDMHTAINDDGSAYFGGTSYDSVSDAVTATGADKIGFETPNGLVTGNLGSNGETTIDGVTYTTADEAAKSLGASSMELISSGEQISGNIGSNGNGGMSVVLGGTSYESPEEAAIAYHAQSADVYNGSMVRAGTNASLGNGGAGDYMVAPIKGTKISTENESKLIKALDKHSGIAKSGKRFASGMMMTEAGESYPVRFSKEKNDSWTATVKGNRYDSLRAASLACGANSVNLYGRPTKLNKAMNEHGSLQNTFMNTSGVKGGPKSTAMPQFQGIKVLNSGNNEVHGVYADMKGNVKPFSGTVVDNDYAKAHPEQCLQLGRGKDAMHLRVEKGHINTAFSKYAENTTYENGKFVNKYDDHKSLNEDGLA